MVLTGLKLGMQTVQKRYGRELARKLFRYSLDSIDTVEQVVKEENIDCGFARYGHLLTANKPKHFDAFEQEVEFMEQQFNYKVQLISRQDQRQEIGSDIYHGALLDECSGGLNPAQYVAGLAKAAERAGALLHARARVEKIDRRANRFLLGTERGSLSAESVLVGTSGYTGSITKRLQMKIVPVGSFIIA